MCNIEVFKPFFTFLGVEGKSKDLDGSKMKVAVIGGPTFVNGFKLVGFEGFKATSKKEVVEKVEQLVEKEEYGLILLPERYTDPTKKIRAHLAEEGKVAPTFTFLPDYTGKKGQRIEELKQLLSLALGVKLEL